MHKARLAAVTLLAALTLVVAIAPAAVASQIPVLTDVGTHGYAYPNCPSNLAPETITVSNLGSTEVLSGLIETEQVVPISATYPDGRRILNKYPVGWAGPNSFSQTITWPSFNDPTVLANAIPQPDGTGTLEFHVDIAIDVYDGGTFVITLGPGQDYDVFCIGLSSPPPPPPPTNFGTRTLGYWKTHTTLWPVGAVIQVGSTYYNTGVLADKQALITILQEANAKDITYMLAAQLITAELNYASGSPQNATSTIASANTYLSTYPVGSNPQKSAKDTGSSLTDGLDQFNQSLDKG